MYSFLSVTAGTETPAKFLEIHYAHPDVDDSARPIGLVGKGITFDSGGISLKPGPKMGLMRSDMGGAGCLVAATVSLVGIDEHQLGGGEMGRIQESLPRRDRSGDSGLARLTTLHLSSCHSTRLPSSA